MNRVKKASWGAVLVGGLLLGLSAMAAGNTPAPDADQCKGHCSEKATAAMRACVDACPRGNGDVAKEKLRQCVTKCDAKQQSSLESCNKGCPKPKPVTH